MIISTRLLRCNRNVASINIGKRCRYLYQRSHYYRGGSKEGIKWLIPFSIASVGVAGVSYISGQDSKSSDDNNSDESSDQVQAKSKHDHPNERLMLAIDKSRQLITQIKEESGSPGISVAVSCNGRMVWTQGFGYSDIENQVPCTPETVMRIASISKPIRYTISYLQSVLSMVIMDELIICQAHTIIYSPHFHIDPKTRISCCRYYLQSCSIPILLLVDSFKLH